MVDFLLSADWAKLGKGRALYVANAQKRVVCRVRESCLTFDTALAHATELAKTGSVLLSFDLPLGLPNSYFSAIHNVAGWQAASSFTSFLPLAARTATFFVSGTQANRWSLQQPFFAVPPGAGARAAFEDAAAQMGVQLRRRIDIATGGNPMLITHGIPGSVGSAAMDVWRRLAHLLPRTRNFRVWPFEGSLPELFESTPIVIAENYPRAIYAAALSGVAADCRPRLRLSKTRAETRHEAIKCLLSQSWVERNGVTLDDIDDALADENQFDALLTAAGLLRLVLEGEPLSSRTFEDPVSEGGILGTGTINFDLPEANFGTLGGLRRGASLAAYGDDHAPKPTAHTRPLRLRPCPIAGCPKVFIGSRGGWDGHIGAFRMHPTWQPGIKDHRTRLEVFRAEYAEFFD